MIRKHYLFNGTVQGVGFRYRAVMAAREFGVTGWIENQWDGSVLMEAQGDEADLEKMIVRLGQSRFGRIEKAESRILPLVEGERRFIVR